jgi:hypothetical protein
MTREALAAGHTPHQVDAVTRTAQSALDSGLFVLTALTSRDVSLPMRFRLSHPVRQSPYIGLSVRLCVWCQSDTFVQVGLSGCPGWRLYAAVPAASRYPS